jgi:2-haloacid dehalogenase
MSSEETKMPRALAFDVFGTVVDWRASVIRELEELGRDKGIDHDWAAFADAWRAGYQPAMNRVRRGELGWTKLDTLHRLVLDDLLARLGIDSLAEDEIENLNRVWHRLDPWPDSVQGLTRLRQMFTITTLSNGNVSLLTNMAKRAGLPWDCVVSAELFHHYKPDPETYLGCAELLDVTPHQLMLVASHPSDLRAAQRAGLLAAYVIRPLEHGHGAPLPAYREGEFDIAAKDFTDLAQQLTAAGLPAADRSTAPLEA